MSTLFEYNEGAGAYDVVEYEPPAYVVPTFIAGVIVHGHWRLGPHDADRWRHNFRRHYEQQARIAEATVKAENNQHERVDRAWRLHERR